MNNTVRHPIHVIQKNQLGKRLRLYAFHRFLDRRVVPFKAVGSLLQGFKVFLHQSTRTAGLVLVSLFVVESVKVVVTSKIWIQENFLQNTLVKFDCVKFWTNLVRGDTSEWGQNTWKETTEPPCRIFNHVVILLDVVMRKASFCLFFNIEFNSFYKEGD